MLGQYVRSARGRIVLNVIDPKPDTPEEEKAAAAGVMPQTWPSSGEQFYFGLVAIQAEQQKVIPALVTDREQFLEYDLSQLLYQVQLLDRRKLGLLSGVPLRPEMDYMAMQSGRMPQSQLVISEWEKTFEIVTVDASADSLPGESRRARHHPSAESLEEAAVRHRPVPAVRQAGLSRGRSVVALFPLPREPDGDDGRPDAQRLKRPARSLQGLGHRL